MGAEEFDEAAEAVADAVEGADLDERIAAACRGSGNPAALAWLAEGLGLRPGRSVVDLGAGLGGPAAWLARHHRCRVVGVEPADGGVAGADRLFDVPVVRAAGDASPFRTAAFDAAVVLGVLSVVPDPAAVLREAARLAGGLGVLEWCSTGSGAVAAGGSRFPTPEELHGWLDGAGWCRRQSAALELPVPWTWSEAAARGGPAATDDEREVAAAIDEGRLRVQLVLATRAP